MQAHTAEGEKEKAKKKYELLTIASLVIAGSFTAGLFCFEKLPEFITGPDILRREESIEDKPAGRPSSPPVTRIHIKRPKRPRILK